jgi:deazaflavin-dependent oxidoreductase (nitroreductase family)
MLGKDDLAKVFSRKLIHLTSVGRRTGKPHTVELWFAVEGDKIYLSHEGELTDWMRNIRKNDRVSFEIDGKRFIGKARYLENHTDDAEKAKIALYEKYYGKAAKEVIDDWFSLSRLIVIELREHMRSNRTEDEQLRDI